MDSTGRQGLLEAGCFNCPLVDFTQTVGYYRNRVPRCDSIWGMRGQVSLRHHPLKLTSLQLRKCTRHFTTLH
jgi:hypothetical protein